MEVMKMKKINEEFDGIEGSFSSGERKKVYAIRREVRLSSIDFTKAEYGRKFPTDFADKDVIRFDTDNVTTIRQYSQESGLGGWNRGREVFSPSSEFMEMVSKIK